MKNITGLFVVPFFLLSGVHAYSQQIIRIVKQYALVDTIMTESKVGDRLIVSRRDSRGLQPIGLVRIVAVRNGMTAVQTEQVRQGYQFQVGDFISRQGQNRNGGPSSQPRNNTAPRYRNPLYAPAVSLGVFYPGPSLDRIFRQSWYASLGFHLFPAGAVSLQADAALGPIRQNNSVSGDASGTFFSGSLALGFRMGGPIRYELGGGFVTCNVPEGPLSLEDFSGPQVFFGFSLDTHPSGRFTVIPRVGIIGFSREDEWNALALVSLYFRYDAL